MYVLTRYITRIVFRLSAITAMIVMAGCEKQGEEVIPPLAGVMTVPDNDTLRGIIAENVLLTNNRTWYIDGWICVVNESSLHIEPGTILHILGKPDGRKGSCINGGIIVSRGATIIAAGTAYSPVIIDCRDPSVTYSAVQMGIILLGRAPVSNPLALLHKRELGIGTELAYGGALPDDSSGVIKYVQIRYPVTRKIQSVMKTDLTGLLLLGTGSRTVTEQISVMQADGSELWIKDLKLP